MKRVRKVLHALFNRVTLTALLLVVELLWLMWLIIDLSRYYLWIGMVFTTISLLIIAYILRRDDNPAYKLGWVLLIAIVPLFGWMTYAIFGNKHMSRRMHRRIVAQEEEHRRLPLRLSPLDREEIPPRFVSTIEYLSRCGGAPAHGNTDAAYFSLGEDMFVALKQAIAQAERYIFMEYFIISPGTVLDELIELLSRKAAQGVEVRLLYDDFGVRDVELADFSRTLARQGIKARAFNPIIPIFSVVVNHRNHRKVTVIDGKIVFTGGINLADEYVNRRERFGHWKDTGLCLRGDAVQSYTVAFLNLWNATCKRDEDYMPYLAEAAEPYTASARAPQMVQPYFDSPLDEENVGESVYLEILAQAQKYVYIFTPYLVIDSEMQTALCLAAKRGVDVRIVTPGIPDKKAVFQLTRSYYSVLLRAGVRIYEYTPGFIHAKSFLCDDVIATVGTFNLDYRSLYLHFECGALLRGGEVISHIRADYEQVFSQSSEICSPSFGRARGLIGGIKEAILRALAPLM